MGGIQTHDLTVASPALYHAATTLPENISAIFAVFKCNSKCDHIIPIDFGCSLHTCIWIHLHTSIVQCAACCTLDTSVMQHAPSNCSQHAGTHATCMPPQCEPALHCDVVSNIMFSVLRSNIIFLLQNWRAVESSNLTGWLLLSWLTRRAILMSKGH